ncbi:MAG: HD domain-containing protein [Sulfuricurvum sp.]|uniref:HD domain-containing protein n=1 Tax=Sulfuricurvum sp. TaxID=2025608 RepID=UPI0026061FAB|nr:HD domain-containing protein [Sulfuricurvum sp.]MDD5160794.1 HD domain-containing protein [Sulfuricurvum sp.]
MNENLMIVGAMGVTYFALDYYFKNQNNIPQNKKYSESGLDLTKSEYTLDELAKHLWLRNDPKRFFLLSDEEKLEAKNACPPFINQEIKFFWDKEIAPMHYALKDLIEKDVEQKKRWDAVNNILYYLDENAHYSSVSGKYHLDHESKEFHSQNTYDIFSEFSILTHSLGVASNILISVCKNGYNNSYQNVPTALIIALGHDLGKIARQKNANEVRAHEIVSVDVIREICPLLSNDIIEFVSKSILLHHTHGHKNHVKYLNELIEADHDQRISELKEYKKRQDKLMEMKDALRGETDEKLRLFIYNALDNPADLAEYLYFDKSKSGAVYFDIEIFKKYSRKNNIEFEQVMSSIRSFRKSGLVTLIDFSKFASYHMTIKYNNEEALNTEVIPVDYTQLGLSVEQIVENFLHLDMPKMVLKK